MKLVAVIVLSLSAILACAQGGDAVFTVSRKTNLKLVPDIDTLLANKTYHFKVTGIALKDISAVIVKYGKVVVNDTDIVLRTNQIAKSTQKDTLLLFSNSSGKQTEVFEKVFTIVKLPEIKPTLLGANVMDRNVAIHWWLSTRQLYARDTIPARIVTETRANITASAVAPVFKPLTIKSFKVDITCDGITQQYKSLGGVTATMEEALKLVTPGCTIKLYDVYTYSGDEVRIVGPYIIYISP